MCQYFGVCKARSWVSAIHGCTIKMCPSYHVCHLLFNWDQMLSYLTNDLHIKCRMGVNLNGPWLVRFLTNIRWQWVLGEYQWLFIAKWCNCREYHSSPSQDLYHLLHIRDQIHSLMTKSGQWSPKYQRDGDGGVWPEIRLVRDQMLVKKLAFSSDHIKPNGAITKTTIQAHPTMYAFCNLSRVKNCH